MTTPDPRVYRKAAEHLRKNGWTRGVLEVSAEQAMDESDKETGQSCVNGALLIAMGLDPVYENYGELSQVDMELGITLEFAEPSLGYPKYWAFRVEAFNDAHSTTAEDVIAALLETAARLERESFTQSLLDAEDES